MKAVTHLLLNPSGEMTAFWILSSAMVLEMVLATVDPASKSVRYPSLREKFIRK
jgi:hypothetical protein